MQNKFFEKQSFKFMLEFEKLTTLEFVIHIHIKKKMGNNQQIMMIGLLLQTRF